MPLRPKACLCGQDLCADRTAVRIMELAESTALPAHLGATLCGRIQAIDCDGILMINSWGPGNFDTYSVHQLEPIVMLMKGKAKRVLCNKGQKWLNMTVEFEDGRVATLSQMEAGAPFMMNICSVKGNKVVNVQSDFFKAFIKELVSFYRTGIVPVPHEETVEIMAIREKGLLALETPGEWVYL